MKIFRWSERFEELSALLYYEGIQIDLWQFHTPSSIQPSLSERLSLRLPTGVMST